MSAAEESQSTRRSRLDRAAILDAVMRLARNEPQTRLTMKRLGRELGVDGSAIYRHFRDREELIQAATDRLIGIGAEEAHASQGSWRKRLESHLMRVATLCLTYPPIGVEVVMVDPVGPGGTSALEFLLEMLSEAGLHDDDLIEAYAALSGFAISQSAAMASDVMTQEPNNRGEASPWIAAFTSVKLTEFPLVRKHLDALLAIDGMDVYRAGVARLLDAVESQARA